MDIFAGIGALSSTITILETSKKVNSKTQMLYKRLREGKVRIGIFGAGGTGKTTLAYSLAGKLDELSLEYTETPTAEEVNIGKNVIGNYWIAPGQEERIQTEWPQMFREITNGKITGIINVVSYGYHATDPRIPWTGLNKYYTTGQSKADFLKKFQEERLKIELKFLEELVPRIKDSKKKIWMITLVTKQDLWWQDRLIVQDYYTKGIYNEKIQEIQGQKGKEHFKHDYLSASVVINSLRIGSDIFVENSQGYDVPLQNSNLLMLLNQINSCLK